MKMNNRFAVVAIAALLSMLALKAASGALASNASHPKYTGLFCLRATNAVTGGFDDFRLLEVSSDGTMSSFASTQGERAFDGQKGVWESHGKGELAGVILNFFHLDPLNPVLTRGNFSLSCNNNHCDEVNGRIELDFGDNGTDLDGHPGFDLIQVFDGRRVTPSDGQGETGCSDNNSMT